MRWLAGVIGIGGMLLSQPVMASSPSLAEQVIACGNVPVSERLACHERVAQGVRQGLSCDHLPNNERLACHNRLAQAASRPPITAPSPGERREVGAWWVSANQDRMTDEVFLIFMTRGVVREPPGRHRLDDTPYLGIGCDEQGLMISIHDLNITGFLGEDFQVRARLDRSPAVTDIWRVSDHNLLAGTNGVLRVRDMANAQTMLLEVPDVQGSRTISEFSMNGLRDLLHLIPCLPQAAR